MQKHSHLEELYDRVQKTACSRFFAHDRLKKHHAASLWTIAFFSVGLIVIPLIQTFGLHTRFSESYIGFIQVVLAIVILTISIMLNMSNFSVRADRIHKCGMVLNALARRVHGKLGAGCSEDEYEALVTEYNDILQAYENHSRIDYLFTKRHMTNYYKVKWYQSAYYEALYWLQFSPYAILIVFEGAWIYMLVKPT
ncbi:SLATT domain-containing protein [Ectothiorhodospira variabilis]|uniref:SLATT domain-containing protein n=1 Tax=Ectothiorhodospira variabilis TaxID=505694 RepID=UPI001EFBD929|nr:SLATT domain-containing protein [Ectothiorhodospira variabilis]MCG5503019.1 SLATT domain-containing protein [Ectothiorhodospira variabilis]MCG5508470.1 SLATT domain-containing protein [Ectothiorhodospira variabilis]